jgi:hypothetical protein
VLDSSPDVGLNPMLLLSALVVSPSMRTTGAVLLGSWMSNLGRMLQVADARDRWCRLLYFAAVPLLQLQARADRLGLEVKGAPELVARARRVVPERHPVALTVSFLAATSRLDVVLTHEADDVDDLNGHVAAVVADVGYRGDSLFRAVDLWSGKAVAVSQEIQAIRRYLNERRPLPHTSSIPSPGWPHHALPRPT